MKIWFTSLCMLGLSLGTMAQGAPPLGWSLKVPIASHTPFFGSTMYLGVEAPIAENTLLELRVGNRYHDVVWRRNHRFSPRARVSAVRLLGNEKLEHPVRIGLAAGYSLNRQDVGYLHCAEFETNEQYNDTYCTEYESRTTLRQTHYSYAALSLGRRFRFTERFFLDVDLLSGLGYAHTDSNPHLSAPSIKNWGSVSDITYNVRGFNAYLALDVTLGFQISNLKTQ